MDRGDPMSEPSRLPRELLLAFAPVHKSAFGVAVGVVMATLVLLLTLVSIGIPAGRRPPIELLANYFRGYSVSGAGALIGAAWAGFMGFVFGWFLAFCRNLILAVSLFVIRTRAELAQTRDFLDHI